MGTGAPKLHMLGLSHLTGTHEARKHCGTCLDGAGEKLSQHR